MVFSGRVLIPFLPFGVFHLAFPPPHFSTPREESLPDTTFPAHRKSKNRTSPGRTFSAPEESNSVKQIEEPSELFSEVLTNDSGERGNAMLTKMMNAVFGCRHSRYSFPITMRPNARRATAVRTGTYVVCLDCGREFSYDWQEMKVAEFQPKKAAHSLVTKQAA